MPKVIADMVTLTTAEIDTFISDVSTTSTNIGHCQQEGKPLITRRLLGGNGARALDHGCPAQP